MTLCPLGSRLELAEPPPLQVSEVPPPPTLWKDALNPNPLGLSAECPADTWSPPGFQGAGCDQGAPSLAAQSTALAAETQQPFV